MVLFILDTKVEGFVEKGGIILSEYCVLQLAWVFSTLPLAPAARLIENLSRDHR